MFDYKCLTMTMTYQVLITGSVISLLSALKTLNRRKRGDRKLVLR